jgi:hypothetical protein
MISNLQAVQPENLLRKRVLDFVLYRQTLNLAFEQRLMKFPQKKKTLITH